MKKQDNNKKLLFEMMNKVAGMPLNEDSEFMGLNIIGDKIMGYEPYFDKDVIVASINNKNKEIRPAHGYFIPHKYGVISKKYADSIGYDFNNN